MEVFLQLHAPSRSDFTCGRMPLACEDAPRAPRRLDATDSPARYRIACSHAVNPAYGGLFADDIR